MRKWTFCMAVAMLSALAAGTARADSWTGDTLKTGVDMHIVNVAAGTFLSEGDTWGTRASLDDVGTTVRLLVSGDGYSIKTLFGSNYMYTNSSSIPYMDGSAEEWTLTKVDADKNYYTIANSSGKYLQWSGSGSLVNLAAMPSTKENAYWLLVRNSQMEDSLASASLSNPKDATFLLTDPSFAVLFSGTSAWSGSTPNIGGYRANTTGISGGNYAGEFSEESFDMYETAALTVAGIYGFKIQGFGRAADDTNCLDAIYYIGDAYATLPDIHTNSTVPTTLSTAATQLAKGNYAADEIIATTLTKKINVGVRRSTSEDNDWTVVDNLRLVYYGNNIADYQTLVAQMLEQAKGYDTDPQCVPSDVKTLLDKALEADATQTGRSKLNTAVRNLNKAISAAKLATAWQQKLGDLYTEAEELLGDGSGEGADDLTAALADAATKLSDKSDISGVTSDEVVQAYYDLKNAMMGYKLDNGTGSVPTVTTDTRSARGNSMIFIRMSYSGVASNKVKERGICYSTSPNPTYTDGHSTKYLTNSGNIYYAQGLTPGTMYYVRPYVMTTDYAIGYGDQLKIPTLPAASVKFTMRYTGDAADARIEAAAEYGAEIWNKLTSITGFNSSIGYASGTPTADCSYGGYMRVGPSTSYQRTGTIFHEWLHGVGVGTLPIWYGPSVLRANSTRGLWLGERANEALRFWDNDNSTTLTGDGTHMWPYGINGAHEDNGTLVLYYGTTLIAQGLFEDGMAPVNAWSTGFALPAYVFQQEDDSVYYIKNEDTERGLSTHCLADSAGTLKWIEQSTDVYNPNCAWKITFTPSNQYYQIQNVGTGNYISYSNATFKTLERTTLTSAENLHLMKGRVDVSLDGETTRGYWFIHPGNTNSPYTMLGAADGEVGAETFDLSDDATKQRWVIIGAPSDPTGITSPTMGTATKVAKRGIYTLDGRLISTDTTRVSSLPQGIYVVNGKKVVK